MSLKDNLLETSDRFRKALLSNDVDALDGLIADDYVGYDPQGNPQDKKLSIEAYQPGGVDMDRYDVEEIKAEVIGEVGMITGKGCIHGSFAGCGFEHDLRFLDIYVLREGKWLLYLSQVTPLSAG